MEIEVWQGEAATFRVAVSLDGVAQTVTGAWELWAALVRPGSAWAAAAKLWEMAGATIVSGAVQISLTAAETAALAAGRYQLWVKTAQPGGGPVVVIAEQWVHVRANPLAEEF